MNTNNNNKRTLLSEPMCKCENEIRMCLNRVQMQGNYRPRLLYMLLLLMTFSKDGADASAYQKIHSFAAQKDFSTYTVIKPQIYDSFSKQLLKSTLDIKNNQHIPNIILSYIHKGQLVHLDLTLYKDLLPDEHFLKLQSSNDSSKYIVKNFTKTECELCQYQGSIKNKPNSRAALSTCNGDINGIVFDENDAYIIHTERKTLEGRQHFLLQSSNLRNQTGSCGHTQGHDEFFVDSTIRKKRSSDEAYTLHGPFKSNKESLYVELAIVVDNGLYRFFEEHLGRVHQYCKDLANVVNALYSQLNIFVILTEVVVWNERDEIVFHNNAKVTLDRFLEYRKLKLSPEHPNDHAQLLTKNNFDDSIVGKAYLNPMCSTDRSGAVCVAHSDVIAIVANTMAHEMGHNFGMPHDDWNCKCPEKQCIMSDTSSSYIPTQWSSCSIESLNDAYSRGLANCLRNKPKKQTIFSPICGNGIVEPGEECDCGLPLFCNNNCCDPKTCRLRPKAACGSGECCDLRRCHLKKAGTACRLANDECDLSEFCTGESEFCPKDVYKYDTAECDSGLGYCYQGICGSHEAQCRILWGSDAVNSPHCYLLLNQNGNQAGNCGVNPLTMEFTKCPKEHVQCGRLQCSNTINFPNSGIAIGAQRRGSHKYYNREPVECHSALFDFGAHRPDPGMSPNGAKCGEHKMCLDQKCISIADLRAQGLRKTCPDDCNGNGDCNSQGNCHCYIGFGGSTCRSLGPGGSIESGPETNPNSYDAFHRFLYIFFCGVIPFVIIFVSLLYFCGKRAVLTSQKFVKSKTPLTLEDVCSSPAKQSINSSESSQKPSKSIKKSGEKKMAKSVDCLDRNVEVSHVDIDVSNLPKVAESIENLTKNLKNERP